MTAMIHPPILVTGAPRSSTTFLGKMLAMPRRMIYLDEPFNMQTGLADIEGQFPYIPAGSPEVAQQYRMIIQKLLDGQARFKSSELRPAATTPFRRFARQAFNSREYLSYRLQSKNPQKNQYLLKDPMACYLAEYLHQQFRTQVVVIVRHPLSTIASYKRLNWHYGVKELLQRKAFTDHHTRQALSKVNLAHLSAVEEWSLLWLSIYATLKQFSDRNPGILVVTHEELSTRPHEVLRDLYTRLNLPFSLQVQQRITEHTNAANPTEPTGNQPHALYRNSVENLHRWKKILTPDEAATIKKITTSLAKHFYDEISWE